VGAIALAVAAYITLVVPRGELGEKRGWTVLQGTEVKYRGNPDTQTPILLSNPLESSFVVLGLPTEDTKFPMAWIILNDTTPSSSVYILPQDQKFRVACSYVDELSAKVKIVPLVSEFLRSRCGE
jgi:hypothetical protein